MSVGNPSLVLVGTEMGEIHLLRRRTSAAAAEKEDSASGASTTLAEPPLCPSRFSRYRSSLTAGCSSAVRALCWSNSRSRSELFLAGFADGVVCLFHSGHALPMWSWRVLRASTSSDDWGGAGDAHLVGLLWVPGREGVFMAVDNSGVCSIWDLAAPWPACCDVATSFNVLQHRVGAMSASQSLLLRKDERGDDEREGVASVCAAGNSDLLRDEIVLYATTSLGRVLSVRLDKKLLPKQPRSTSGRSSTSGGGTGARAGADDASISQNLRLLVHIDLDQK